MISQKKSWNSTIHNRFLNDQHETLKLRQKEGTKTEIENPNFHFIVRDLLDVLIKSCQLLNATMYEYNRTVNISVSDSDIKQVILAGKFNKEDERPRTIFARLRRYLASCGLYF